jgi:hypothetical protein
MKMRTGIPDSCAATIAAEGALFCLPAGPWRRRAGEIVRAMRARWAEDAGAGARAFRPAFFFMNTDDSGTALEGTTIFRARKVLVG